MRLTWRILQNHQVKGPNAEQVHDIRDKTSEKHEFVAFQQGVYRFCFTNKSPYHETIDFDVHAGHFLYHDEHAKDGDYISLSLSMSLSVSVLLAWTV